MPLGQFAHPRNLGFHEASVSNEENVNSALAQLPLTTNKTFGQITLSGTNQSPGELGCRLVHPALFTSSLHAAFHLSVTIIGYQWLKRFTAIKH